MRTGNPIIPDHVPPELVVDFDFFDPPGADSDVQLAWARLHDGPDIVWTPHNGGHWIATRADDIDVMQIDHLHFSHDKFNLPVNPAEHRSLPLSLDPPEHGPYRKLIMPAFLPKAVKALEHIARETARGLIDGIAPRGRCEFIADFAKILPINVFLGMVDLPLEDRDMLLPWAEVAVRSDDVAEKNEVHAKMAAYLGRFVAERAARPGGDLISDIIRSEIDGRPVTMAEVMGVCVLLLFGGLDTVASQLGFIADFLARHPDHRRQLIDRPALMPMAIEELLRRFGLPNTARIVTMDYDYKGIRFRKGDMIQMPKCLYGLDDRRNDRPGTVDFARKPSTIKHAAFGAGPHTCPGAVLARREIIVFLEEWLPRIPDFEIDPDAPRRLSSGMVNGVLELPLRWTPAAAVPGQEDE